MVRFFHLHGIALGKARIIEPSPIVIESIRLDYKRVVIDPLADRISPPTRFGRKRIGAVSPGRVLGILRQISPIGPDLAPAVLKFIQDHYVGWGLQDFACPEIMQIDAREATWITLENRIIG